MFYDKQSNNQVLRMQTIHTGMPLVNEAEELKCVLVGFIRLDLFSLTSNIDGLQASNSPLYTRNRRLYLSYTNVKESRLKKVSKNCELHRPQLTNYQ